MNDIDKLDGMIKFKGKCGYKFIGGCRELKKYKQALEEIRDRLIVVTEEEPQSTINLVLDLKPIIEGVLNDRD